MQKHRTIVLSLNKVERPFNKRKKGKHEGGEKDLQDIERPNFHYFDQKKMMCVSTFDDVYFQSFHSSLFNTSLCCILLLIWMSFNVGNKLLYARTKIYSVTIM